MTGKIILVDGVDCTGKTTICNSLREMYPDAIYYHSPTGDSKFTRDMGAVLMEHTNINPMTHALLFLATHITNINRMNTLKREGHMIIADRSLLSTMAYQKVVPENFLRLCKSVLMPKLDLDLAYILTAPRETILGRMAKRGMKDKMDKYFMDDMGKIIDGYSHYALLYPDARLVDTHNKTTGQITIRMMKEIDAIK